MNSIQTKIEPRWLSLKAASDYSNIGVKRLKKLAEGGRVKGFQDPDSGRGDWVFDRLSIDAYRERQDPDKELDRKCIAILNRLK